MAFNIGVVFDLDGTLVASESLYFNATERILAPLGRSLKELTAEERSRIPGRAAVENMEFYRQRFGIKQPAEELVKRRMSLVMEMLEQEGVRVTPGAKEFVADLKVAGIRLSVASSAPDQYVRKVLSMTGLLQFFQAVITGDQCSQVKPSPEIFLRAAQAIGLPPKHCLAVEDAHAGILGAKAAGMKVLAVRSPYTLPEQTRLADLVVENFIGLTHHHVIAVLGT